MQGRRFVLVLYALLVGAAAAAGALIALFVERLTAPRLFFLIPLPPTVLGFAVYGAVTIATVLGVGLLLVEFASRQADAVDAGDGPE